VHDTKNQESFITYELEKGAAIDLRLDYNQAKRTRKDFIDGAPAKTAVSWKNNVIKGNSKTLKLVNISRLRGDSVQHSLTQGIELIDAYYDSDGSRSERDTEAAFLGYGAKFGAHDVQTNLRHDKVSLKTTSDIKADMKETSYLAGYGYRFAEHYKIALSHATGFRAPSAGEYGSNQDLKPETYTSNEVSLQRDKNGRLLRLTAFSTETDNEIKWLSVSPWTPENIQKNENIGLEVSYSGTADKFDFDLDITFQDPKETDTTTSSGGQSLKRAKAYGKLNLSRHIGDYQIGGTLTHSGRKLDSSSKTIASFTRLDGYISRQLGDNLSVNLKAENITNSEYETTAGYRTPERSLFLTLKYDFVNAL
jgi:vitamin B12 transporter